MPQANYFLEHQFLYSKTPPPAAGETILFTNRVVSSYLPEPQYLSELPQPFDIPTATNGPFYHKASLIYRYPHSPPGEVVVWWAARPINEFDLPLEHPSSRQSILPLPLEARIEAPDAPFPNYTILSPGLPSALPPAPPSNPIPATAQYSLPPPEPSNFSPIFPTVSANPIQPPPAPDSSGEPSHDWVSKMCGCVWYAQVLADGSRVPFRSVYCGEPWCRWPVKYNLGPWTYTPTTQGWIRDIYRIRSWPRS
ncbi:hypothetical protein TWF102_010224 [Orbilia oligospora]|uniref:Uncharacterized protein n=1 Tax=Orbilia oligospora TaxID=2813651 RepID=A0A7C8J4E4_ORBOL|nr:hypothetical protein TWF102_010224 [Orbilia oligospora]KAF3105733.1 hypothetical protein TWF706_003827 [Orbilia oligospora]KAF3127782.1 hypothetical protein TWF703_009830 [Orbilia oligospora]